LGDAVNATNAAAAQIGLPPTIHTEFAGTAQAYQASLSTEPVLIAAALATVYIILAMLYESYIHPVTILSTLPSAGVGALLALIVCRQDFSVIALIGLVLLIGIVKKNAIMMIDFAVDAQKHGSSAYDSIYQGCLLRFRPIMMTTVAALFGTLPIALGYGEGADARQPLGLAVVGGLVVSQFPTLYITYLYLERLQEWMRGENRAADRPKEVVAST